MPRGQEGLARLISREGVAREVVEAFRKVAREDFVPLHARANAYRDRPVAIPRQQTTSQPSLIARMVEAAEVGRDDRVLEVGTGFGYQTALLATLAAEVFSIERFEELARTARENLAHSGILNATVVVGDGWLGLPHEAPFDAIVVSAAADGMPAALTEQLREGGRLVIPLKGRLGDEVRLFKKRQGEIMHVRLVTPARFVPLVPGTPE